MCVSAHTCGHIHCEQCLQRPEEGAGTLELDLWGRGGENSCFYTSNPPSAVRLGGCRSWEGSFYIFLLLCVFEAFTWILGIHLKSLVTGQVLSFTQHPSSPSLGIISLFQNGMLGSSG